MTGIALRILLYAVIGGLIYFGIRRIVADWRARFRELDEKDLERDRRERKRPDVVELKRDEDGVYRPNENERDEDRDRRG